MGITDIPKLLFFTGFFVAFWITAVMFKANDVLRKQTALKVTASHLAFSVEIVLGSSLLHRRLFVTTLGAPYHLRSLSNTNLFSLASV